MSWENQMHSDTKLAKEIDAVRTRFLDAMENTIIELDALLQAMGRPDIQDRALEGIRFRTHKISGTAATFGYPRIGELAQQIETAVNQRTSRAGSSQAKRIGVLLTDLLDEMEQALDERIDVP